MRAFKNVRPELLVEKRSRMERFLNHTRGVGELVGHLAKIGAAFSVIIGMTLLVGYLHSAGAGLTSIDTSFGAILRLLTVIFLWFSLVAVLLI